MQSLDRIHRRGQDRTVEYVVLLCDGSIEEDEYERVLAKSIAGRPPRDRRRAADPSVMLDNCSWRGDLPA